jgi:hypothetical protein
VFQFAAFTAIRTAKRAEGLRSGTGSARNGGLDVSKSAGSKLNWRPALHDAGAFFGRHRVSARSWSAGAAAPLLVAKDGPGLQCKVFFGALVQAGGAHAVRAAASF